MLHEIEGVEREIRGREDQILAEMEQRGDAGRRDQARRGASSSRPRRTPQAREARRSEERARALQRAGATRWPRSATRWRPRSPPDAAGAVPARGAAARRGGGRGAGRHVPGLPPEAAAADVRRAQAQRARSCSAPPATGSSTTSRRPAGRRRAVTAAADARAAPHPHRRRQPRQPGRGRLRRHVTAPTARRWPSCTATSGRATQQRGRVPGPAPRPALRAARRARAGCASSPTPSWWCARSTGATGSSTRT